MSSDGWSFFLITEEGRIKTLDLPEVLAGPRKSTLGKPV